jgi:hypothetical protein
MPTPVAKVRSMSVHLAQLVAAQPIMAQMQEQPHLQGNVDAMDMRRFHC